MKIELNFQIDPADYPVPPNMVLARVLKALAEKVEKGERQGYVSNIATGRSVGRWAITE